MNNHKINSEVLNDFNSLLQRTQDTILQNMKVGQGICLVTNEKFTDNLHL